MQRRELVQFSLVGAALAALPVVWIVMGIGA